jgi:hypothetical protein
VNLSDSAVEIGDHEVLVASHDLDGSRLQPDTAVWLR